ncbi:SDR family NAD(P)-dependent oxidoreductase [Novosphingobium sp. KN65.2]|uniref:SDR family NAD(P)-dependent oxidoreductase n=1 Tax=Novosphingobium sp. KN65.2 TaxID=1478134 RepID=UPI0005DA7E10|nr:SDR family NAD(P)-dependent oxidoreductase [Novosphingobium sp. KN65.2]CDO38596.1 Oxidoreductase protein [Novosphingobium sp. KN65.2]
MVGRLEGKVCVITGSGGSMGRAAALLFAAEGAAIVGCDVNVERASAVCEEVIAAGGHMVSLEPCDLTDPVNCRQLVDLAVETYGKIDVLFNNAAMAYFGWIDQMPADDWYKTIDQELHIVYLLVRAAWSELTRSGGSIINVASISAWQSLRGHPGLAHCAAKGGVLAMTRQLAQEGAPYGLRVNSISPGIIETHQTATYLSDEAFRRSVTESTMLGRVGKPEDIAYGALFFASDESSFVTGSDLLIDGGARNW